MLFYEKRIVYLDLIKDGCKIKNVGFLKTEKTEDKVKWTIRICGLQETDTGGFELVDETGSPVDKIFLRKGQGGYVREFCGGEKIGVRMVGQIGGLRMKLSGGRVVEGNWEPQDDMEVGSKAARHARTEVEEETVRSPRTAVEKEQVCQNNNNERSIQLIAEPENGRSNPQPSLHPDKWEQLRRIYPRIYPFKDEREFLSIAPADFVILEQRFYKMTQNSFLLHGYYNYQHVVLGKYQEKEEERFYLGVPGIFHDREKMAAEMFGFEAFEGKNSPAEPGSFGYYMKRVRL